MFGETIDRKAIYKEGQEAAVNQKNFADCPYDDPISAGIWLTGWEDMHCIGIKGERSKRGLE